MLGFDLAAVGPARTTGSATLGVTRATRVATHHSTAKRVALVGWIRSSTRQERITMIRSAEHGTFLERVRS